MELFAADGHDAGGCERVTGKSGMRPVSVRHELSSSNVLPSPLSPVSSVVRRPGLSAISPAGPMFVTRMCLSTLWNLSMGS